MKLTCQNLENDQIPVIVGIGEITEYIENIVNFKEPIELMSEALRKADADSETTTSLLNQIDSLDIVNLITCDYDNIEDKLCELLPVKPKRVYYGPVGGETPVKYLHEAAIRIYKGESVVSAICGGESLYSLKYMQKNKIENNWPNCSMKWISDLHQFLNPLAISLDVAQPTNVYPFYENALVKKWDLTPAESLNETAELWSKLSEIAANNPFAWQQKAQIFDEIKTVSKKNRLISWPYPKSVVANPNVNQGAAIIVTSLAKARELGIPDEKLIYFWVGASAKDTHDYTIRKNFYSSEAMSAVLEYCQSEVPDIDAVELYSCFPCVPKMAKRILNLPKSMDISVTGGLSYFGAPLNNYMTHSIAAMVRLLRSKPKSKGLIYGQGEFVTKHHALVLANYEDDSWRLKENHEIAKVLNTDIEIDPNYKGVAKLETFTVLFDRDGEPRFGVVILEIDNHRRTLAKVEKEDTNTLSLLLNNDSSPIGVIGNVSINNDGIAVWSQS